jgi:hypothetical protein
MPINPFSNNFIPLSNLNLIQNMLLPNTAFNQGIPQIPNFSR